MTDYVLEQQAKITSSNEKPYDFYLNVTKYAKFLKQPLTLSMFIPTDSKGNVLKEPELMLKQISFGEWEDVCDLKEVDIYKKAQEKVLFKDFEAIVAEWTDELVFELQNNEAGYIVYNIEDKSFENGEELFYFTIEDIINCGFELTDSAVFNLFGEK